MVRHFIHSGVPFIVILIQPHSPSHASNPQCRVLSCLNPWNNQSMALWHHMATSIWINSGSSHYLNQSCLLMSEVLWNSSEKMLQRMRKVIFFLICLNVIFVLGITTTSSGNQWVKSHNACPVFWRCSRSRCNKVHNRRQAIIWNKYGLRFLHINASLGPTCHTTINTPYLTPVVELSVSTLSNFADINRVVKYKNLYTFLLHICIMYLSALWLNL